MKLVFVCSTSNKSGTMMKIKLLVFLFLGIHLDAEGRRINTDAEGKRSNDVAEIRGFDDEARSRRARSDIITENRRFNDLAEGRRFDIVAESLFDINARWCDSRNPHLCPRGEACDVLREACVLCSDICSSGLPESYMEECRLKCPDEYNALFTTTTTVEMTTLTPMIAAVTEESHGYDLKFIIIVLTSVVAVLLVVLIVVVSAATVIYHRSHGRQVRKL